MIRVFLVDDHEIVRRGLAQLINAEPDLQVVGESATVRGTLAAVDVTRPEVMVLDVHLPDGTGIDLCRSIRSAHPEIRCLMLTAHDDDAASVAAVIAGASGHALKSIRGSHLIEGIHRVARGENLIGRELAERVHAYLRTRTTPAWSAQTQLTLREEQILRLITEGLTNRQIGSRLGLAEKTVKNYVSSLLAKLGMERRTQVAAYGATKTTRGSSS